MNVLKFIPWRMQSLLGFRPNKVYKDIFEFQRTNHKSLVSINKVGSASIFHLELPKFCNVELPQRFHINHFKAYPDVYLAKLNNCTIGVVSFRVGVIIENNGLLLDLSRDHAKKKVHPFLSYADCRAKKTLKGKSLILAAPTGEGNYYHWMFHVIGRLSVLKALEVNLDEFDNIILNKTFQPFQKQSLEDFNLPKDKLLFLDEGDFIKIENATIPSYLYFHPMVPHFLKRFYLHNKTGKYPKKIYISRRKSKIRKLIEEDALVEMLINDFGYLEVFMEELSLSEQANTLNRADYVIAPHGAGVSNTIYCNPGTKVMEILPYTWINVIYWIYAEYMKLNYAVYMAGAPTTISDLDQDYNINLEEFRSFIIKSNF